MRCKGLTIIIFILLFGITACGSNNDISSEKTVSSQKEKNSQQSKKSELNESIPGIGMYKTVDADEDSGFVIKNDNSLWVWGRNACGQCGNGTKEAIYTPEKVMEDVKAVKSGGSSACTLLLKTDNSLWGCGYTEDGILAEKTTDESTAPTPVHIMDNVLDFENEGSIYFAIKDDNSLWGWGRKKFGILGSEPIEYSEVQLEPVKIADDVSKVCCDGWRAFMIKTDNSLWYWGNDSYGYKEEPIVDGRTVSDCITTPKKLSDGVKEVDAVNGTVYYIKMDNTLYGWGSDPFYSMESQYLADDVKMIKGCHYVRTDGVLCRWSGGRLEYCTNDGWWKGQEGFSEPEKLIKDVAFIASGANFIKEDGTLWTCGDSATKWLLDAAMLDEYGRLLDKQVQVMDDIKIQ